MQARSTHAISPEPSGLTPQQKALRLSKYGLAGLGVVLLGVCAVIVINAALYQSYQNWAFEQIQSGRAISRTEFLLHFVKRAPAEPESPRAEPGSAGGAGGAGLNVTADGLVARLEIPSAGVSVAVMEGVDARTLRQAVGHMPGTAFPGAAGNIVLAAHRDTFFRGLRNVHEGDPITLNTLHGSFTYVVDSLQVIQPQDVGVLGSIPRPTLTLVTCYPFYFVGPAPERYIVRAHQVTSP
ncbi:MAG TPA: class D sortase [Terriglobia bacterium]|nr:class D sortase [Terriglobia bacterium]